MPLDLLVPHLLLPPDAPPAMREARFARVEKWLARADVRTDPAGGAADWLALAFGIAAPPPVAAIALAGEGAARPGAWLRADPVHLRIVEDHLVLHEAAALDVTPAEALALAAALQAHFAADGLEWHAAAPGRWYVRAPPAELPRTTPLERALGRDVYGLLPVAAEGGAINWRSALTEAQMVLSSHDVNVERERTGKPAVNSVWFWGEGTLPESAARPYSLVHADDPFALGLARLSRAEARPLPRSIEEIDLVRAGDSVLAVIGTLGAALARGGAEAWREAAAAIDAAWFAAIDGAIERFGEVRVVLPAAGDTRIATLTRAARWRWLRPRRPLSSFRAAAPCGPPRPKA